MNQHQLDNFRRLKEKYFPKLPASLSASDGTFLGAEYQWDMVRLGAAMYGINTAPYRENQMKSVVTVKAPVLQIADLPKGDFVGYSAVQRRQSFFQHLRQNSRSAHSRTAVDGQHHLRRYRN